MCTIRTYIVLTPKLTSLLSLGTSCVHRADLTPHIMPSSGSRCSKVRLQYDSSKIKHAVFRNPSVCYTVSHSSVLHSRTRNPSGKDHGIQHGQNHRSADDSIVSNKASFGMVQDVVIVRPQHCKAKGFIPSILSTPYEFERLTRKPLHTENTTKENGIGGYRSQRTKDWYWTKDSCRCFCQ